jgi:ATP-dependent Zn protease
MMNANRDNRNQSQQTAQGEAGNKKSSDFVTGLITFVIFIVFMTLWMYFSTR